MRSLVLSTVAVASLVGTLRPAGGAAEGGKDSLQGVWVARSMESNGKPAPADVTRRMRFTFKGDKLLIRGNFNNDREEECAYKVAPGKSPKHLDFTPPNAKETVLGIYELKGQELKVCLRHAGEPGGRPTAFATRPGSGLVLIVFRKQKE